MLTSQKSNTFVHKSFVIIHLVLAVNTFSLIQKQDKQLITKHRVLRALETRSGQAMSSGTKNLKTATLRERMG